MELKLIRINPTMGQVDGQPNPPGFPWLDTGLSLASGQRLTIIATGRIHLYPPELTHRMEWKGPEGCVPANGLTCGLERPNDFVFPNQPGAALIARIGTADANRFVAGTYYDQAVSVSGNLYLSINDYPNLYYDNRGYFSVLVVVDAPGVPNHDGECPICADTPANPATVNPIKLRTGDKVMTETDLSVQTPASALAFIRSYRQSQQTIVKADARYRFLGLGWGHNHDYKLTLAGSAPNRTAEVLLPEGGTLKLTENGSGHFDPLPGSNSVLDYVSSEYVLTAQDKSTFVFEGAAPYRLKRRTWPNNEIWTYTQYTSPHYAVGKLKEVSDGYGRKLQFTYYNASGAFNHLHLWRVGDQNATGLETPSSPVGRYLQFTYTESKKIDTGVIVTGGESLLTSVRDVRGNIWTYEYNTTSLDVRLNFLTKRLSPTVDTDYDGSADGTLTLEEVVYQLSGSSISQITQKRGNNGIITDLVFQAGGQNITTETTDGKVKTHYFANGVYAATGQTLNASDVLNSRAFDADYRPEVQADGNGNSAVLTWAQNGKRLTEVEDALGQMTQFNYNSNDTLNSSLDAEARKTEYTYGDSNVPRQPTRVRVLMPDEVTVLRWQEFTYDTKGRTLTEKLFDPANGTTLLTQTTRTYYTTGNGNGLQESITQLDLQDPSNNSTTTYFYDAAGRVTKTQKSSLFGNCQTSFTVYDDAGNVVASICNYDPGANPDPTTAQAAAALYNPSQPDKNQVTTHQYDALGRRIATTTMAGAAFAQTTLTFYDALDRVWRTISNYVAQGSTAPGDWVYAGAWRVALGGVAISHGTERNQNIISDTTYDARGMVKERRDALGKLTRYVYDDAGRLVRNIANYVQQSTSDPATWVWDAEQKRWEYSAIPVNHGTNDQNIITEQVYDPAGNLLKTFTVLGEASMTVYDALNRPIKTINAASTPTYDVLHDPALVLYAFSTASDKDIVQETTYDVLGRVVRTKDAAGIYTLYGYDGLGRQVRVIRSASSPDYLSTEADASLSAYPINPAVDKDILTETVYDAQGRVRYTLDATGAKTWNVYDGLGRQFKTISNCTYISGSPAPEDSSYKGNLTDPAADLIHETVYDHNGRVIKTRQVLKTNTAQTDLEWTWTLYGFDALGRQVKTIRNASNPSYNTAADPTLASYTPSANADEDLISETVYDAQGRVIKSIDKTSESAGLVTLYGYDTVGRRVKTVQNASNPSYNIASDPSLASYTFISDPTNVNYLPDQDIVTTTVYDLVGRTVKTTDSHGNVTLYGYDALGRQIKVIQNASNGSYDVFSDPDLSAYTPGSNSDQDRITETVYDLQGRVIQMKDALTNIRRSVYDTAGRQVRTITNYVAQGSTDPKNWVYESGIWKVAAGGAAVSFGANNDENRIADVTLDKAGRSTATRDTAGNQALTYFDAVGRTVRTIANFLSQGGGDNPALWVWDSVQKRWETSGDVAVGHGPAFDRNHISDTHYNKAGQVVATRDVRGTVTSFGYDAAGRRRTVTQDAGGTLQTTSYSCYDKAGRTLREIANWIDMGISPDAQDSNGDWLFVPTTHGANNDQNLIVTHSYDLAGRRIAMTNPAGEQTTTTYRKDGQVLTATDALGIPTRYVYDKLRRRRMVVQSYVAQGASDPADWVFEDPDWKVAPSGASVDHDGDNDENIIVQVTHDLLGRMTSRRDPRGNVTSYEYDKLGRRIKLTNPLSLAWDSAYADLTGGKTRTTMTYPGVNGGAAYNVQRDHDRLGRVLTIDYGDPTTNNTPDVAFSYNAAGDRTKMSEYGADGFTGKIRETVYGYDLAHRLTSVGFDNDGGGTVDETISYVYDLRGQRTQMTLPGSLTITYRYDAKGRLIGLTDWDGQSSSFGYDQAGRHNATERGNGLRSRYDHDAAGRLRRLLHTRGGSRILRGFDYSVNALGNRTQAQEIAPRTSGTAPTTIPHDDPAVVYTGIWAANAGFAETSDWSASLGLLFFGTSITLRMGQGADHSLYDVYLNQTLWQSYDGYAVTAGERAISITLEGSGPHLLEIRNRRDKHLSSSSHKLRFKHVDAQAAYDVQTIDYSYDKLSRLRSAHYAGGDQYAYGFDLAGNRTSESINSTPTNYSYNAANQITNSGFAYDNNGNLTSDGTNTHTWDRANRLLSMGGHSYAYDGNGNRVSQTVSSITTRYLLDLQPGLALVIGETVGANTTRYIHAPRGIHAMEDTSGNWTYPMQDGLGSVRGYVDAQNAVLSSVDYSPYGVPDAPMTGFAFTGEWRDGTVVQYHRARYTNPALGTFLSLDPFEGAINRPMSLNGYAWVEGNVVNLYDATGMCVEQGVCDEIRQNYRPAPEDFWGTRLETYWRMLADFGCLDCVTDSISYFTCEDCCNRTTRIGEDIFPCIDGCVAGFGNPIPPWTGCDANRLAVIPPFIDFDERVNSVGFILGIGRGSPAWYRALRLVQRDFTVGVGPSIGAAAFVMFDVNIVHGFPLPIASSCSTYISFEAGVSLGFDLSEGAYWGIVLSSAAANDQAGFSWNFSTDIPIPSPRSLLPDRQPTGVNLHWGVSSVVSNCNYSAYYAAAPWGGLTASFTLGYTSPPLASCQEMLEPFQYTTSELADYAAQFIGIITQRDVPIIT